MMTPDAYRQLIAVTSRDRLDLSFKTANRPGAPVGNVEKDFWVSWTLNTLHRERPARWHQESGAIELSPHSHGVR